MSPIQAIILSVVEGITEFLPISSTGHLILAAKLLGITETNFVKSFEIIIQLGAILAVVVLYFSTLLQKKVLWPKLITAFLPTAIVGLILYKFIKTYLLGNSMVVIISLFLGGLLLIAIEKWLKPKDGTATSLTYPQSLVIGAAQSLSVIPGVSRAAATIVGGLTIGLSRQEAVEFSFLLAIPTMIAATGLDVVKNIHSFTSGNIGLIALGMIVSFVTALIAVKWLLGYVKNHSFVWFGVYRMIAAILFFVFVK